MALSRDSKYPNRRTYVLKMRSDASSLALAGRMENLVTGQQREFASGEELIATLVRDLEASAAERPPETPGA